MKILLSGCLFAAFVTIGCLDPRDATPGDIPELTSSSVSALSSIGGDITATEILDRARFWYQLCNDTDKTDCTVNEMWYTTEMSGDSDFHADPEGTQYRKDCSGLVSMALHFNGSLVTSTLPGVLTQIAIDNLQPGDVIDDPNDGSNGHTFLFERWGDSAHFYYYAYDFGTTPIRYRTIFRSGSDLDTGDSRTFYAYHYPHNIDTTVTGGSPRLFYNPNNGNGATALLDSAGHYSFVSNMSGFATGWTHIVGTSNGSVLFYNASTGAGATALLDSAGHYSFVSSISGFATGWTHIVPANAGSLLFYNASTGAGATALLDSAGHYSSVSNMSGFAKGWTRIVGASNGSVLFYNASTGAGATALLDSAGHYGFVSSISGFATGWTHIVPANAGSLLFYNASTGAGATALLDSAGHYSSVGNISGFATGWTHIVGASNGSVLFYNASTGAGATALLDSAGHYGFVSSISGFATGWTLIGT